MKNKLKRKQLKKVTGGNTYPSYIDRDLNVTPINSDKATTPDNNALPSDVLPKQNI